MQKTLPLQSLAHHQKNSQNRVEIWLLLQCCFPHLGKYILVAESNLHPEQWLQDSLGHAIFSVPACTQDGTPKKGRVPKASSPALVTLMSPAQPQTVLGQVSRNRACDKDSYSSDIARGVLSGEREQRKQDWPGGQGGKNEPWLIPRPSPASVTQQGQLSVPPCPWPRSAGAGGQFSTEGGL